MVKRIVGHARGDTSESECGSSRAARTESAFHALLETDPSERAALLQRLSDDDAIVADDASRLLRSHLRLRPEFLESPSGGLPAIADPHETQKDAPSQEDPWIGRRVDSFTLTRRIAVGGTGAVYEAVQDRPRRSVAIKLMRSGFVSADARRRFEYEAEVLANLRHPGIAQVYAAGTLDDHGIESPYIVMELVAGARSLLDFSQKHNLLTRQRVTLFIDVCDAVHFGHQRGVIHRDLKPGNILVDSGGRAKTIDFGVARVLGIDALATLEQTDSRQIIGTVPYMSPEHFGDSREIDSRSDVYALGVVLYELLSGDLPHDVRGKPLANAARFVREEPPRALGAVRRALGGDLETIVMHALEKDPARRYPSAAALADDLRRFLDGLIIAARRPTLAYQLTTLIRRHKVAAFLAASLAAACVVFGVAMTSLYLSADQSRRAAENNRARAETAQQKEQAVARRARQALVSLQTVLSGLAPADARTTTDLPAEEATRTPLEILDCSLGVLNESFKDDALVRSSLLLNLAQLYSNYGHQTRSANLTDQALALRRTLPGLEPAEECNLLRQAAFYWMRADNLARATVRTNEALELARRSLAEDNVAAIEAVCVRAEIDLRRCDFAAAAAGFEDALVRSQVGGAGRRAYFHGRLARVAESAGQRDQALSHARQAVTLSEAALGADHAQTRNARAVFERWSRTEDDPEASDSVGSLLKRGRCADAERLVQDQIQNLRMRFGADSPHLGATLRELATVQQLRGNLDSAVGALRSIYASERRLFYSERPDLVCGALYNLAAALWARDGLEATQELYEDAFALHALAARAAPDDRLQDAAPLALGLIEIGRGRLERAEELLREALAVRARVFSERHHLVGYTEGVLALALLRQNRTDEAEVLAKRAYATCAMRYGVLSVRTHDMIRVLIELNDRRGDTSDAEAWRARLQVCPE